uniref:Uncharacterized protein n=1 Tax=Nelumbo nucifera TaxID=4432 RepID=A0A822YZC2_NELNU|nr:TPA_asm: hypothetical protein HUJ06_007240 [Nelumbo nucifera]
MKEVMKHIVNRVIRKTLYMGEDGLMLETHFCEKEVLQIIEHQPVFSYLDDPTNPSYALLQLREVLVEKSIQESPKEEGETDNGYSIFKRILVFQEELKARLGEEVDQARERLDNGDFPIPNMIKKCRTYPIYRFVRTEVGTELLSGVKKVSPGEHIEKINE